MSIELLGPEGAMARMRELQARAGIFEPKPKMSSASFAATLDGQLDLGDKHFPAELGGNIPFNPMGGGATIRSAKPPAQLKAMIEKAALEAGVDPKLFDALVAQESSYDPNARSRAGAMGLTQLMPSTAQSLGVTNPFDPEQNLRGGAQYLSQMIGKFGDARLALAAYNAGAGRVEAAGRQVPDITETKNYVARIMDMYKERGG